MMDELKPCPFCGGKPFLLRDYTPEDEGTFYAYRCHDCGSRCKTHYARETCPVFYEQLRIDWNTRATDATLRTLKAKVKAMHAGLPYFNVPHFREGLEDMLDVIGKIGDEK